jgi:hypothetical protein
MEPPTPIKIGYYYDSKNQKTGAPNMFAGERHLLIFGLNGAGKSTRFLIENLVKLRGRSIVVFDVKGELAAQTARTRRKFSDVKIINPYGVVGLPSDGYNPLAILDPSNEDEFSDRAAMLADAIIEMESIAPHWSESAQGLLQAGIMWEVQEAVREDRAPSLARVRQLLTEPDEFEGEGRDRVRTKGLALNAGRMVAHGGEIIASLVGRFLREHGQNELSSIQSTFDTQTRFLLSPPLARDLEKNGVDFRQLRERPTTVYIVLPPTEINRKRRWTRLLISAALCEHMRPGPVNTLFVLDEFRASVGHLQIISDVWSLVRGYGIQLMPVVQSATQLEKLFEREWENFAAQAGAVVTIGPPNDLMTANWMSEISGNQTIWQDQRSVNTSSNQQGGGVNISDGLNYGQAERRFLLPQELRSMADGTGRIWTPGMGECSIPFFAPNWWHVAALKGRVDQNPYYPGNHGNAAANSPASAGSGMGKLISVAGWLLGLLAALWTLAVLVPHAFGDFHAQPDFTTRLVLTSGLILFFVGVTFYGTRLIVDRLLRLLRSLWPPLVIVGVIVLGGLGASCFSLDESGDGPDVLDVLVISSGVAILVAIFVGVRRRWGRRAAGAAAPTPVSKPSKYDKYDNKFVRGLNYYADQLDRWFPRRLRLWALGITFGMGIVGGIIDQFKPPTSQIAADRYATVSTDNVNLLDGPGPNYNTVGTMPQGLRVKIDRDADGGWEEVDAPQKMGRRSTAMRTASSLPRRNKQLYSPSSSSSSVRGGSMLGGCAPMGDSTI